MSRLTIRDNSTTHENGVCCTHFKSKECIEVSGNCSIGCKWEEEAWSKLAEYEDLEEQGLLLRTPIAEQTEIWTKEPFKDGIIRKGSVEVLCFADNRMFSFGCSFSGISLSVEFLAEDLGETVFLTREEAEQRLKEMERNV